MYSLLLALIYISFISLGLPDSLLGSAWPVMQPQLDVPLSYAGIVSMIIAGGTVCSSLLSDRSAYRIGTGKVTAISVGMTAVALFGFSASTHFFELCLWAIPYGLGAGGVDAALNNYVALHYKSRHMSWLHCFWGVGASIGPYIMGYSLSSGYGWENGYFVIFVIQIILTAILFMSLPLWKQNKKSDEIKTAPKGLKATLKIKGVAYVLVAFFSYCALETTTGLWTASYLVREKGIDETTAATCVAMVYLGVTLGRFLCGFVADKFGDKTMIRLGIITVIIGIIMLILPLSSYYVAVIGVLVIGFGCAPIYPSIIHSTPHNFGAENSQAVIGVQMASAYLGSTFMPSLFGFLANNISISLYPYFLMLFAVLMLFMTEKLNVIKVKKNSLS